MPESTAEFLARTSAELSRKRTEVKAILQDQTQRDKHRDALKALIELNHIEGEMARVRMKDRATAFAAVGDALNASAPRMTKNVFADLIGDIRLVLRTAGVQEPPGNPPPDSHIDVLDDLIAGLVEHFEEAVAVDPAKAANEPTPDRASSEQGDAIAAIAAAAKDRNFDEGLLGAVAWVESRLRNVTSAGSTARGLFQFLPKTWNGMVASIGQQLGILESDIDDMKKQAVMAAEAFKGYRKSLEKASISITRSRLYLCHLLGAGAAKACLKAASERPVDAPLRQFYAQAPQGAGFADKILNANPFLRDDDGDVRSVGAVLEWISDALDRAEGKYNELKGDAPKAEPSTGAGPRWYQVALGELKKKVTEKPGDEHNPSIIAYLATTTLAPGLLKDETAWCSAFVNWCLKQAGITGTNDALARSWERYGNAVTNPMLGDIAVFWRQSPTIGKGHVGFFVEQSANTVSVLGGNQKVRDGEDGVSISKQAKNQLLGFRRPP